MINYCDVKFHNRKTIIQLAIDNKNEQIKKNFESNEIKSILIVFATYSL